MPLLDHFRPPLSRQRHWESFHASWCSSLADSLNQQLPAGYFAEELTHAGATVEIDLATFEEGSTRSATLVHGGGTATLPAQVWAPPEPALTVPAVFADDFEVRVFSSHAGPTLVGVLAMVSPANKDRPEARHAFAVKCASYLHQGISLIVVDVVSERRANLHNELVTLLPHGGAAAMPAEVFLYAVAYRPVRRQQREEIDLWPKPVALGEELPVLPLFLNAELALPVDLETTYQNTCRRRRLT